MANTEGEPVEIPDTVEELMKEVDANSTERDLTQIALFGAYPATLFHSMVAHGLPRWLASVLTMIWFKNDTRTAAPTVLVQNVSHGEHDE